MTVSFVGNKKDDKLMSWHQLAVFMFLVSRDWPATKETRYLIVSRPLTQEANIIPCKVRKNPSFLPLRSGPHPPGRYTEDRSGHPVASSQYAHPLHHPDAR